MSINYFITKYKFMKLIFTFLEKTLVTLPYPKASINRNTISTVYSAITAHRHLKLQSILCTSRNQLLKYKSTFETL